MKNCLRKAYSSDLEASQSELAVIFGWFSSTGDDVAIPFAIISLLVQRCLPSLFFQSFSGFLHQCESLLSCDKACAVTLDGIGWWMKFEKQTKFHLVVWCYS